MWLNAIREWNDKDLKLTRKHDKKLETMKSLGKFKNFTGVDMTCIVLAVIM